MDYVNATPRFEIRTTPTNQHPPSLLDLSDVPRVDDDLRSTTKVRMTEHPGIPWSSTNPFGQYSNINHGGKQHPTHRPSILDRIQDPYALFTSPIPSHSSPLMSPPRALPTLPGIIGTVPCFSGDISNGENIIQFFSMFERAARSAQWDDDIKIAVLISKLKGRVLRSFNEGMGMIPDVPYDEIKQHLIYMYQLKESRQETIEKFFRTFQEQDESVESFFYRIKGISSRLGGGGIVADEFIRERFIDGLLPLISRQVLLAHPVSLVEALRYAREFELVELRLKRGTKKVNNVVYTGGQDEDRVRTLERDMENLKFSLGKLTTVNPILDLPPKPPPRIIICDTCNQINHISTRCPNSQSLN